MMRRITIAIIALCMAFVATAPAFAATTAAQRAAATKAAAAKAAATKAAAAKKAAVPAVDPKVVLDKLRTKGEAEVQRRFDKLNAQYKVLIEGNKLDPAAKQTFGASMQAEATSLGQLKDKIHAETDLAAMRTDIKALADEFVVYRGLLIQASLLVSANGTADVGARLVGANSKLTEALAKAAADGRDVQALQERLQAAVTKLAAVDADFKVVAQAVLAIDVKSAPTAFGTQRDRLKADRASLESVRAELTSLSQAAQHLGYQAEL